MLTFFKLRENPAKKKRPLTESFLKLGQGWICLESLVYFDTDLRRKNRVFENKIISKIALPERIKFSKCI